MARTENEKRQQYEDFYASETRWEAAREAAWKTRERNEAAREARYAAEHIVRMAHMHDDMRHRRVREAQARLELAVGTALAAIAIAVLAIHLFAVTP